MTFDGGEDFSQKQIPLILGESKEKKKPKKAENQGIQNRFKPKEKTVRINNNKYNIINIIRSKGSFYPF